MGLPAFLSSVFRHAPSFNSQTLRRLLSFSSTEGQSEEGAHHPDSPPDQSQPPQFLPVDTSIGIGSLELETPSAGTASTGDAADPQQDSKRVGKLVLPIALFLGAASFGLIVNRLPSDQSNIVLVTGHITFVYLSLFVGVGLSMYSILTPTSRPEVAWVQKKLIVIGLVFIQLAFVLRTCVVLPIASLEVAWLLVLLIISLVALCLVVAWRNEGYVQTAQAPDHTV